MIRIHTPELGAPAQCAVAGISSLFFFFFLPFLLFFFFFWVLARHIIILCIHTAFVWNCDSAQDTRIYATNCMIFLCLMLCIICWPGFFHILGMIQTEMVILLFFFFCSCERMLLIRAKMRLHNVCSRFLEQTRSLSHSLTMSN